MIDYWLWDLVDCMRYEEDKILDMNTTYTVKHIQRGLTLFIKEVVDEHETISGRVWLDSPGRLYARRGAVSDAGGDTGAA